jgi:hypothetical protein
MKRKIVDVDKDKQQNLYNFLKENEIHYFEDDFYQNLFSKEDIEEILNMKLRFSKDYRAVNLPSTLSDIEVGLENHSGLNKDWLTAFLEINESDIRIITRIENQDIFMIYDFFDIKIETFNIELPVVNSFNFYGIINSSYVAEDEFQENMSRNFARLQLEVNDGLLIFTCKTLNIRVFVK